MEITYEEAESMLQQRLSEYPKILKLVTDPTFRKTLGELVTFAKVDSVHIPTIEHEILVILAFFAPISELAENIRESTSIPQNVAEELSTMIRTILLAPVEVDLAAFEALWYTELANVTTLPKGAPDPREKLELRPTATQGMAPKVTPAPAQTTPIVAPVAVVAAVVTPKPAPVTVPPPAAKQMSDPVPKPTIVATNTPAATPTIPKAAPDTREKLELRPTATSSVGTLPKIVASTPISGDAHRTMSTDVAESLQQKVAHAPVVVPTEKVAPAPTAPTPVTAAVSTTPASTAPAKSETVATVPTTPKEAVPPKPLTREEVLASLTTHKVVPTVTSIPSLPSKEIPPVSSAVSTPAVTAATSISNTEVAVGGTPNQTTPTNTAPITENLVAPDFVAPVEKKTFAAKLLQLLVKK